MNILVLMDASGLNRAIAIPCFLHKGAKGAYLDKLDRHPRYRRQSYAVGHNNKKWAYLLLKQRQAHFVRSVKYRQPALHLGYGNGTLGANFNTGLTAKTLVHINRIGLAVNQFKNLSRTSVYTFLIAGAFIGIYFYLKHN